MTVKIDKARLLALMDKKGYTPIRISRMSELTRYTVYKAMAGDIVSMKTVIKIASVLSVDYTEIICS
ncbi:Uncharacterised protein [uncultured Clostridium sp.]|nr:Uncharacterised protein [uncultured Clostridium sp.]